MAKRYHNSKREAQYISVDDGKHRNVNHSGFMGREREQYAGLEETRMSMAKDGALIKEDWNATALLPKNVIDRDWPRAANYDMGTEPDLFDGVQKGMKEDAEDMRRAFHPGKY